MGIGKLALKSGISIAAIRYYESLGLLSGIDRKANGHREFTAENLDTLTLIKSLREAGMTLKEVQDFVGVKQNSAAPCNELAVLAAQKAVLIRRKIIALRQAAERLKAFSLACNAVCDQFPASNCLQVSLLNS